MPFSPLPERPKFDSEFKKNEFIKLPKGTNTIRILDDDYVTHVTHYLQGKATIECLGKAECPICLNNKRIIVENPETFRSISGYIPQRILHYVNVLDRTPAKICPQCQEEVKAYDGKFPNTCSQGHFVANVDPAPLNKVKILNKGNELFDKFLLMQKKYGDITKFDIELDAYDKNDKKTPNATAVREQNDVVEVPAEDKFDLTNIVPVLTADEVTDLLKGISLKDIYNARKSAPLELENTVVNEAVQEQINKLFPNQ